MQDRLQLRRAGSRNRASAPPWRPAREALRWRSTMSFRLCSGMPRLRLRPLGARRHQRERRARRRRKKGRKTARMGWSATGSARPKCRGKLDSLSIVGPNAGISVDSGLPRLEITRVSTTLFSMRPAADAFTPPGAPPRRGDSGPGARRSAPPNRFERLHLEPDPAAEPFEGVPVEQPHPRTEFYADATETLLTPNQSPDIPFAVGMNVYRGCEHGCAYCYARPFHEFLGWNSGLDFETRILVKHRAPALLRHELSLPRWNPQLVRMSGVSDCYQPGQSGKFKLTRQCLEVCAEFRNPIGIVTKSFLVTRDRDLLAELARWSCIAVSVFVTITTLDGELAGQLEPAGRASGTPAARRAPLPGRRPGIPVERPGRADHPRPDLTMRCPRSSTRRRRPARTSRRVHGAAPALCGEGHLQRLARRPPARQEGARITGPGARGARGRAERERSGAGASTARASSPTRSTASSPWRRGAPD